MGTPTIDIEPVFDKIGILASAEHRSMTNYIEFVLLRHIEETEKAQGPISANAEE